VSISPPPKRYHLSDPPIRLVGPKTAHQGIRPAAETRQLSSPAAPIRVVHLSATAVEVYRCRCSAFSRSSPTPPRSMSLPCAARTDLVAPETGQLSAPLPPKSVSLPGPPLTVLSAGPLRHCQGCRHRQGCRAFCRCPPPPWTVFIPTKAVYRVVPPKASMSSFCPVPVTRSGPLVPCCQYKSAGCDIWALTLSRCPPIFINHSSSLPISPAIQKARAPAVKSIQACLKSPQKTILRV